jgi:SAM-dependent methyltransferase
MPTYLQTAERIAGAGQIRSFLDLGAGVGMYTRAAEELGLDAHYVEIDEQAVARARDELGLRSVMQADIQSLDSHPSGPFDLVLSRHTIEHLLEPARFASNLSRLVAPRKVVVLETPNAENLEQWAHPGIFRHYWRILGEANPDLPGWRRAATVAARPLSAATPPKHVYGFTAGSLSELLARHGFEVRETVVTVAGDPIFDPLYFRNTGGGGMRGRLYRRFERGAGSIVRALGRGSRLIVFAQRMA